MFINGLLCDYLTRCIAVCYYIDLPCLYNACSVPAYNSLIKTVRSLHHFELNQPIISKLPGEQLNQFIV
jgi:hypothetical protein